MKWERGWGRGPEGLLAGRVAVFTAGPLPRPSPAMRERGENQRGELTHHSVTHPPLVATIICFSSIVPLPFTTRASTGNACCTIVSAAHGAASSV